LLLRLLTGKGTEGANRKSNGDIVMARPPAFYIQIIKNEGILLGGKE